MLNVVYTRLLTLFVFPGATTEFPALRSDPSMTIYVGPHTTKGPTEDLLCSSTESHKYLFVTAAAEPQIVSILSVYILLKVSLNSPTTGIKY